MSAQARQSLAVLAVLMCALALAGLTLGIVIEALGSGVISLRITRGEESLVLSRATEPVGFYLITALHGLIAVFSGGFGVLIGVLFLRRPR